MLLLYYRDRMTKTDRKREGVTLHFFRNKTACCPVAAMNAYLTGLNTTESNPPLFTDVRGRKISQTWVVDRMRAILTKIGLVGKYYSGISLRRGGAQTLLRLRANDKITMGMGRWKSACFNRYLSITEEEIEQWQQQMAKSS